MVSNQKMATQLLQTELQDSRAQVEEKENMIDKLKKELRESEVWFCSESVLCQSLCGSAEVADHTYMQ